MASAWEGALHIGVTAGGADHVRGNNQAWTVDEAAIDRVTQN
jgi:hypothetical protein